MTTPANTVVVMPRPSPSGPFWALSLCLGILIGFFARDIWTGPGEVTWRTPVSTPSSTTSASAPNRTPSPAPTQVFILLLATATETPLPTAVPLPTVPSYCTFATPGTTCQIPPPIVVNPAPTAYPDCAERMATRGTDGSWCTWATATPVPAPTSAPMPNPMRTS